MEFSVPAVATVAVDKTTPKHCDGIIIPVGSSGTVPKAVGLSRAALKRLGFNGETGERLLVATGSQPGVVVVGIGDGTVDAAGWRDAAANGVRAFENRASDVAIVLNSVGPDAATAQAVGEGALLAGYRYIGCKTDRTDTSNLTTVTLVVPAKSVPTARSGAAAAEHTARSQCLARELANTPPGFMNATDFASVAQSLASQHGVEVEILDEDQLEAMGCGGVLGVNQGSVAPPRVVRLEYRPKRPQATVALVGKGVMYDSGGISLKPSNDSHVMMKMDMSGAAAVLATMMALEGLGCRNRVVAWMMCTDNMPSGSALKLGDVLTIYNGTTVEVHNTDAEGRLVLADGLSLACEVEPDVIADIATLTGAALAALGPDLAAVLGNDDDAVGQAKASAATTDEPVWELPLETKRYRKLLDSQVADLRNIGGPYAGTITAAIFLSTFVGETPWVHIDMAGPMNSTADSGWKAKGASGFGTRLLIDFALNYRR